MSFKYLNIKLSIFALGLIVVIAVMAVFGVKDPARAATGEVDCLKPLSIQDQAACDSTKVNKVKASGGNMVAWFFPPSERGLSDRTISAIKSKEPSDANSAMAGFPIEALLLFGAAIMGIVYLGRRRKPPTFGK